MSEQKNTSLVADLSDASNIYKSYLTFVEHGALFIPTEGQWRIGEVIDVDFLIPGKKTPVRDIGTVVWITPVASFDRPQGVALKFSGEGVRLLHKIETMISGRSNAKEETYIL